MHLQARLDYLESGDPTLQDEEQVPDEFDDLNHHQALAFAHYIDAYEVFLRGADVYPEQERLIEERYGTPSSRRPGGWLLTSTGPQRRRMRLLSPTCRRNERSLGGFKKSSNSCRRIQ